MIFQREKQNVSASQLLQCLADGDEIQLSQCTITGRLNINRLFDLDEKFQVGKLTVSQKDELKTLTLSQSIIFDKCTFEENVVFTGPWSESDNIKVEFGNDVVFNSSIFKGQGRFRNAIFSGAAGFDGCIFEGLVTFKKALLRKDTKFRTVTFNGYSLFDGAIFESTARFTNSHFVKGVNFSKTKFNGGMDFSGVYSSSRAVPIYESVSFGRRRYGDDEGFWRFVKQSAQEAGYYQLAGECFYSERCARLRYKVLGPGASDTLPRSKKILRMISSLRLLPELLFGKLLFGYGERPVRVLVASVIIIFACAFIYTMPDMLASRGQAPVPSFMNGLYFSTITFTTLGYGDLYPADNHCRIVAMSEAISGGFLMALFVVCLAKRFSRS